MPNARDTQMSSGVQFQRDSQWGKGDSDSNNSGGQIVHAGMKRKVINPGVRSAR